MFITVDSNGKITGRYAQKQECMDCIEVTDDQLASVPYPKWDKTEKKIINAADDQADAIGHVLDAILSISQVIQRHLMQSRQNARK